MTVKQALVVSTFGILCTSFAHADNSDLNKLYYPNHHTANNGHIYFGLKGGQLMIDEEDTRSLDDPMTYGGFMGYQFNDMFGVEIDYLISSEESVTTKLGTNGKYDVASYGTYLTYRHPLANNLYAKSKLGIAGAEVNVNYGGASTSTDDIGIASGLGLGYRISPNVSFEGEFNLLRSEIIDTNSITFGARFQF